MGIIGINSSIWPRLGGLMALSCSLPAQGLEFLKEEGPRCQEL